MTGLHAGLGRGHLWRCLTVPAIRCNTARTMAQVVAFQPAACHGGRMRRASGSACGPAALHSRPQLQQQHSAARPSRRQACQAAAAAAGAAAGPAAVLPEGEVPHMTAFLDGLKWDSNGLVVAIAQHVDSGEVLMQAFADRAAVCETLQTG